MSEKQEYRRWDLLPDLTSETIINRVVDDFDGLRIDLRVTDNKHSILLQLWFESYVAYRNINESFRSRTWEDIEFERWSANLYLIEKSRWLAWLKEEAGGVLDYVNLKHYAIYTNEDCFEVATEFEPEIIQIE